MATSRAGGVLRRLGLLLSGLVVVALTLAVAAAATLRPAETAGAFEVPMTVVGAGATTWVCAPAPTLVTAQEGTDLEYDPDLGTGGGRVQTRTDLTAIGEGDAPAMTAAPMGEEAEQADTPGDLAVVSLGDLTAPLVGVVEPVADSVPLVGGVSIARADAGDLRGLTATTCQQPVTSAFVVGGTTELGSSARLMLTNPGDTPATVTLTGWGSTGPLPTSDAPVVVPAGGTRVVLLETISLDPRIAIRIDVEGGRVVPTLQDSRLDGLVAAGTDIVGVAADPATTLVIGGASMSENDDARASLRLVNPGDEAATVSVEMLGPEGAEPLEGATESVVEAGTVVDISLAGVPAGSYGVRVTSDLPVTGAVQIARTGEAGEDDPDTPPVDIAWLPASDPVDRGVLPIPSALVDTAVASVTNAGENAGEVVVTAFDAEGEVLSETPVAVPAGATSPIEIPDGARVLVLDGEDIVASAVFSVSADDGTLAAMIPMVADPYVEQSVAVRVTG